MPLCGSASGDLPGPADAAVLAQARLKPGAGRREAIECTGLGAAGMGMMNVRTEKAGTRDEPQWTICFIAWNPCEDKGDAAAKR